MISSFLVSLVIWLLNKSGAGISSHAALLITVSITTLCWVLTAFLGPGTSRVALIEFCRKVNPPGPGWSRIRREAGLPETAAGPEGDSIPLALLGWTSGCAFIWSGLFTVGNFLYGRTGMGIVLLLLMGGSGAVLTRVVKRLWKRPG
jgi:hypothetical protein